MKNRSKIIIGIVVAAFLGLQIYLIVFMAGFFYDIYQLSDPARDEEVFDDRHEYIDPTTEASSKQLLVEAQDRFEFKFNSSISPETSLEYEYEKDFILANLAYEYARYADLFQEELPYKVTVLYFDDQTEYERHTKMPYGYEIGYGGYTVAGEINIYMSPDQRYSKQDFFKLISHELFHAFQFHYYLGSITTPRWFDEGLADYFSNSKPASAKATLEKYPVSNLSDLEKLFTTDSLESLTAAYDISNNFVIFLSERSSDETLLWFIKNNEYLDFDAEFYTQFGAYPNELFRQWVESRMGTYSEMRYNLLGISPRSRMGYILDL